MQNQLDIDCGGVLDIAGIAQWWGQAQTALQTASALRVKANELQRIDAAGLQAILALFLAANKREIPIQWESSSPALQQAATLTGLTELLQLSNY